MSAESVEEGMHLPDQEAHVRNKPGNRRVVWNLELFGGGQDKWECVEAIGSGQRVTRGDKKVAG
jgi:hypothetical protein